MVIVAVYKKKEWTEKKKIISEENNINLKSVRGGKVDITKRRHSHTHKKKKHEA